MNILLENYTETVVDAYVAKKRVATTFQSEAELEKEVIKQLQEQGYEYIHIPSEDALIANLRTNLEKLNDYQFSESEWSQFFHGILANKNDSVLEKTIRMQQQHRQLLKKDDGTTKNIILMDKDCVQHNNLQVINQYRNMDGSHQSRYDITILVNGLPLVHMELKRRGVHLKEAFNQINRYAKKSFWAGSGLFEYAQLFIISNGTHTKYYSNTTRQRHIDESTKHNNKRSTTSHSFSFTSWWADAENTIIKDLVDFTETFLAKHSLLNILTKYCILKEDKTLMVMRPYQIVAAERILNTILVAHNHKRMGSTNAGGYIWHTTGSGKTLTSFKTAQLAMQLPFVHKVMFIVDRKDLDSQTIKEFEQFHKGSVDGTTNTTELKKRLESNKTKIIVTTIQKLARFINMNKEHTAFTKEIVLIFDECHRSQFGEMNRAITKTFKNYYLFGFTGTPIFKLPGKKENPLLQTTEKVFGKKLHVYSIVDAIRDKNVLPFKVDYLKTMKSKDDIADKKVSDIDRQKLFMDPQRIKNNVAYIRQHFDQKTQRNESYRQEERRLQGFNSIFAVASIPMAQCYYREFQQQMQELPINKQLKVGLIYSVAANEDMDEQNGLPDENIESPEMMDKSSRDFLDSAIKDYNKMFKTTFSTSADKFQNYYKDISKKTKERSLDILIVVNMFLTGFDATTLNTLWVDKNLKLHGLLQAFSRTNRIINTVKTHGNIVCFRDLRDAANESIALFGNKAAHSIVFIKTFKEYYDGYIQEDGTPVAGYTQMVEDLKRVYPLDKPIVGDMAEKAFIALYSTLLKTTNTLRSFDDFAGKEILSERDTQNYQSRYIDLYRQFREHKESGKEIVNDDIVFETELMQQMDITVDYILERIQKYQDTKQTDKDCCIDIEKSIAASFEMRNKKDLIMTFVRGLKIHDHVEKTWEAFMNKARTEELDSLIEQEALKREETYALIKNAFRDGSIPMIGPAIGNILPPISRFSKDNARDKKREHVTNKLQDFFERFFTISSKDFS